MLPKKAAWHYSRRRVRRGQPVLPTWRYPILPRTVPTIAVYHYLRPTFFRPQVSHSLFLGCVSLGPASCYLSRSRMGRWLRPARGSLWFILPLVPLVPVSTLSLWVRNYARTRSMCDGCKNRHHLDHACQHRKWGVTPWVFPASASRRSQNLRRKAQRELTSGDAGFADPFSTSARRVRRVRTRVRCERTPKSGPIQPPRMGAEFEAVPDLTNSV